MNGYDNEISVQQWLDKAYWPWPLALAYSIGANRKSAIEDCVSVLDGSAGVSSEYVGLTALHLVYAQAIDDPMASEIDWDRMHTVERPLVAAIESDKIEWRGCIAPGEPLGNPSNSSHWIGGNIHAEATADLVASGYREFHNDLDTVFGHRKRRVRFYDIHLKAADVRKVVDGEPRMLDFIAHPTSEERVFLDEMFELALRGRPSSDSDIYFGPNGQVAVIRHPSADISKEDARTYQGFRDAANGLITGILTSLVESKETGQIFKVPRTYWFAASGDLRHIESRENVPSQFVGQPLLVEVRHLETWKEVLSPPPSPISTPKVERDADEGWTKRTLKPQTIAVMNFFDICGERWHNGEAGNAKEFLGEYQIWISKNRRGEPFEKTSFEKWRRRWQQGFRVDGRILVFPSQ